MRVALAAVAVVAAGIAAAAVAGGRTSQPAPAFAPRIASRSTQQVSSNWAGYVAVASEGGSVEFSDVTGTWVQPEVTCTAGRTDGVAFWVGLGGFTKSSQAIEQLGTLAECDRDGGPPNYSVWWEIVPAPAVRLPMKLQPGDRVTAAVLVQGQTVTMSLKNSTRRTRFSKRITLSRPVGVSSAEWIAEAPGRCNARGRCRLVPLTAFGTVTFTRATAIGNGHAGPVSDPSWTAIPIELISGGSPGRFFDPADVLGPGVGAVPGGLSADGRSFTVTWQRNRTVPGR